MEEAFQQEFIDYLTQTNFSLEPDEKTLPYLEALYEKYLGQKLDVQNILEMQEYYLHGEGMFGAVGRASKEIRDLALLNKIDQALDQYDRVFVVLTG